MIPGRPRRKDWKQIARRYIYLRRREKLLQKVSVRIVFDEFGIRQAMTLRYVGYYLAKI